MTEYKGIEYLKNKLSAKRTRVLTRYEYYEMHNRLEDFSRIIPDNFKWLKPVLGWCSKTVNSIADRVVFDKFDNDNFNINQIFDMNSRDIFFDSAILSAVIASCCFTYISADEDGYPRLQVIDGGNATGIIDPITNMLKEGYAVLDRDDNSSPILEAYFTAEETWFYPKSDKPYLIKNPAPYPLLVPIINRPDAVRPFGHSRISRACIELVQEALRTLRRSEVAAEYYSFPQKYVLGLSEDAETMDKWKASMSSFLQFTKDEDGDKPVLGQFQQQSMSPYFDQLKSIASLFAGETGLTLDDLGFATSNPASSEAIKASHESLRLAARKAQRTFGSGLLNVGYLAACLRDNYAYDRKEFYLTKPMWQPIFESDAASLAGFGDAVLKINQAVPGYIGVKNMKQLTGLDTESVMGGINISTVEIEKNFKPKEQKENKEAEIHGKSLNGAQTQSLIAIMSQYTAGSLTEGQAVNLISTAIGISKEEARAILNGSI